MFSTPLLLHGTSLMLQHIVPIRELSKVLQVSENIIYNKMQSYNKSKKDLFFFGGGGGNKK